MRHEGVASADTTGLGLTDALSWVNNTALTAEVFLVVGSNSTVGGSFSIQADVGPAPSGEICSSALPLNPMTATPIDGGLSLVHAFTSATDDYGAGPGCGPGSGLDRVFAVETPPLSRTLFTARPPTGTNTALSVMTDLTACQASPRVCVSGVDDASSGQPDTIALYNTAASPQTNLVVIDANRNTSATITTAVDVPPVGDVCAIAGPVLSLPATVASTTRGMFNDYGSASFQQRSCSSNAGTDRVHAVQVPAFTRLLAAVRPDAGFNPVVDLFSSLANCSGARSCGSTAAGAGVGLTETLTWNNGTSASRTVYLAIDSATGSGDYQLDVSAGVYPLGDPCESAEPLSLTPGPLPDGGMGLIFSRSDSLSSQYRRDFFGDAREGYAGRDRVYELVVGAGRTLDVVASSNDPVRLNLVAANADCERPVTCLEVAQPPTYRRLRWTNSSAAAASVRLIVGIDSTFVGGYQLMVQLD